MTYATNHAKQCFLCKHFVPLAGCHKVIGICTGPSNHYRHVLSRFHPACQVGRAIMSTDRDNGSGKRQVRHTYDQLTTWDVEELIDAVQQLEKEVDRLAGFEHVECETYDVYKFDQ